MEHLHHEHGRAPAAFGDEIEATIESTATVIGGLAAAFPTTEVHQSGAVEVEERLIACFEH